MTTRIFLSYPDLGGQEMKWIREAFKDSWVVPLGPNVDKFESLLEEYLNVSNVVALSAGTAALHLGLVMLDIKEGDEVICQSFTFSASANPIKYQGATPVFIDSEPDTWNMDPGILEDAIISRKKVTGKYPKAIIPVHLYGMPAKMSEISGIANNYNIPILEDAAEALGSEYKSIKCGSFGNYAALSFNGNKIITTSGGGALICPTKKEAERVLFFATQAREKRPYYYHETLGYNYRLSNISAGIGCGQMAVLQDHVDRRRHIHKLYLEGFKNTEGVRVMQNPTPDFDSNFWLTTVTFDKNVIKKTPEDFRLGLEKCNIESRWLWRPMHIQPFYRDAPYYGGNVSEQLFESGLCLPSSSSHTDDMIEFVIESVISIIKSK